MQINQLSFSLMKLIQLLQIEKKLTEKSKEELLLNFLHSWTVLKVEVKLFVLVLLTDQTVLTQLLEDLVDLIEKLILVFQMKLEEWKL